MSERIEYRRYSRKDLESMAMNAAHAALVGTIYYGHIDRQDMRWLDDGSIEVFTYHTPAPEPRWKKPEGA